MPQGNPTARVFIWYPHEDDDGGAHAGHVSMYIGNYEVGKNFELALNPKSPDYVMPTEVMRDFGLSGVHYNDNYVSWWPEGGGGLLEGDRAKPKLGLYKDVKAERGQPHVVYDVYGLNVAAMRSCWHETRDKPKAGYQFLRKNCATIVMRVLEAGGALNKIGKLNNVWFGNRLYWTPKYIAQICNLLRDKDLAVKTKAGNCPAKKSNFEGKLFQLMGVR
ncbi:Uncharacterized protein OS=Pseudomonas sp. RIT357 GN=BW43_03009 PE=4 SV=1 [Gemmata massiliana]|uniref:DUF4105 domain-containing protein n=1 Tax=Gemmata massiliana TaxID=1210884 RepID=A0A6P2CTY0_9BACT|nr:hypothetical protein [Gemmata massiliana]VTR92441.1 Uncharacterized protein OS=Pseudomonas sp. RIT357 GN=BW43_03009 PE=4 SV=1 [Gemmata massiliana]